MLHISAEDLAAMKAHLNANAGVDVNVSTNDAVVVFVWMLMRRLRRESGKQGPGKKSFFMQTIDMRGLGIQGLDPNLFGNASVMVAAHMPDGNGGDCDDDDDAAAGRVGTFHHVILQSKHRLMTASIVCPCNQSDIPRE